MEKLHQNGLTKCEMYKKCDENQIKKILDRCCKFSTTDFSQNYLISPNKLVIQYNMGKKPKSYFLQI